MSYLDGLTLRLLSSVNEAQSEVEEKNREVPSSSRRRSTIHLSSSSSTTRFEVDNRVWTHHGIVTSSHINRTTDETSEGHSPKAAGGRGGDHTIQSSDGLAWTHGSQNATPILEGLVMLFSSFPVIHGRE